MYFPYGWRGEVYVTVNTPETEIEFTLMRAVRLLHE